MSKMCKTNKNNGSKIALEEFLAYSATKECQKRFKNTYDTYLYQSHSEKHFKTKGTLPEIFVKIYKDYPEIIEEAFDSMIEEDPDYFEHNKYPVNVMYEVLMQGVAKGLDYMNILERMESLPEF